MSRANICLGLRRSSKLRIAAHCLRKPTLLLCEITLDNHATKNLDGISPPLNDQLVGQPALCRMVTTVVASIVRSDNARSTFLAASLEKDDLIKPGKP